jgi:hypothetical protein
MQLPKEGPETLLGPKLHVLAPVEPMQWRRFIRQPSDAPVVVGEMVGGCSRDNAETEPRRLKHRLNQCKENQGVGLTGGEENFLLNYKLYF